MNKFVLVIAISTIVLISIGVWLGSTMQKPEVVVSVESKVEIPETFYNWGTINLNNGTVNKTFIIKNSGTKPLQLHDVNTSCMCTTAQITIAGQASPQFGMHQKSAWVGEIPPNQEAQLLVTFDPAFHGPSGIGAITRQVTVKTNDQKNPELTFNLAAQVVN
jgi:hypothetical protein